MLAQLVLPLGLAYLSAVVVALATELARPRPVREVLRDAPRIFSYAAATIGVLAFALWFYAELGLVPRVWE